jgi:hypothetical protein
MRIIIFSFVFTILFFSTPEKQLSAQVADSLFSYEYGTTNHLHILQDRGHYPSELQEIKKSFLAKAEDTHHLIRSTIQQLENLYGEHFISWINEEQTGIPLWNKAVVFSNKMKNYYVIQTPMGFKHKDELEGVLYLQWSGEEIMDGYYARRDEILGNMMEGKPTERNPDVFRILDIAAWELDLFGRQDVRYSYAFFPTKSGFEESPDAHPSIPLLACFEVDGYRFLTPSSDLWIEGLTCCGGYFFNVEFSKYPYQKLPFLDHNNR